MKFIAHHIWSVYLNDMDNFAAVSACQFVKKGSEIRLGERYERISLQELKDQIKSIDDVLITVAGKGILGKSFNSRSDAYDEDIFNNVMPNASIDDFAYQYGLAESDQIYITRKDQLTKLVEKFSNEGIEVQSVYLDNIAVSDAFGAFLDDSHVNILSKVKEGSTQNITLDGRHLEGSDIHTHAAAFEYLSSDAHWNGQMPEIIAENQEEHKYKKKFHWGLRIGVFSIFVLLVSSFFLKELLKDKVAGSHERTTRIAYLEEEIAKVKSSTQESVDLIARYGGGEQSRISFYIDRLAKKRSGDLMWNSITIFPATDKPKEDKRLDFYGNRVLIKGSTRNSNTLQKYIQKIEEYDWIAETDIEQFAYNERVGRYQFELKILI
ncbi:MAG TPA: hypothetical protein DDX92_07675 [Flavobacteriales bacterium]|jgi:hypothetical protein|nr:hypothetical protein [Flavobacteriales bacterium]